MISTPITGRRGGQVAQRRGELLQRRAARGGHRGRHDLRVEDVEVEVEEDPLAADRLRDVRHGHAPHARAVERRALRRIEVARVAEHHARASSPAPYPLSHSPQAAASGMPPRYPEPLVAGVLKSPCASSQTTTAAGSRAASTGRVASATVHCAATSTGAGPATAAAAASSTGRAPRRSSSQPWTAGGEGSPTAAGVAAQRGAEQLGAADAVGVRSDVRPRRTVTVTARSTPGRASRRRP